MEGRLGKHTNLLPKLSERANFFAGLAVVALVCCRYRHRRLRKNQRQFVFSGTYSFL